MAYKISEYVKPDILIAVIPEWLHFSLDQMRNSYKFVHSFLCLFM